MILECLNVFTAAIVVDGGMIHLFLLLNYIDPLSPKSLTYTR